MLAPADTLPTPDRAVRDDRYRQALAYLYGFSQHPRSSAEIRADHPRKLSRMHEILARLGNPERRFASVLVAGTKGKGSIAAMLESMARAAGWETGLYTQPHLQSWCERTRLGGRSIRPDVVVALTAPIRAAVEDLRQDCPELGAPTTFEVGTALTFLAFAGAGVRLAVVEVGVGGAHDATNVLEPLLVVLGPISLDHSATLGGTLAEIAAEKAGLFRPNGRAIVGHQPPEAALTVERIARERGVRVEALGRDWRWWPEDDRPARGRFGIERVSAPVGRAEPSARPSDDEPRDRVSLAGLAVPLLGRHQRDNAVLAVAAAHALGQDHPPLPAGEGAGGWGGGPIFAIPPDAIRRGLAEVQWPGRLQILRERPLVVVDGAHNGDSAARLAEALRECFEYRRLHLVLGLSQGKDAAGILDALLPRADRLSVTRSRHERAYPADRLADLIRARGKPARVEPDVAQALRHSVAEADHEDLVCVTGSLFLVAEAIEAAGAGSWESGVGGGDMGAAGDD